MKVTVYRKPACVRCDATERWLRKRGVPFTEVDLMADPDALATVKAMGFRAAPVVVVSDEEHLREDTSWCDYRPDLLQAVIGEAE